MLIRAWIYRARENSKEISFILANAKKGDTLLDIGANKGGFLYWMVQKAGREGKVIGFEPQSVLYHFLKEYFSPRKYPQVTIEQYALSNTEETVTMIIPDGGKPSSPGASIHFTLQDNPTARTQNVETITLDKYCDINGLAPALMKIDVEGHELDVIKGGLKTLAKYKPKIILECEAMQVSRAEVKETFDTILSCGYNGFFYYKSTRIDIKDFNPEKHQPATFTGKKSFEYCSNFFFV